MGTIILVVVLIALTCWLRRDEWFPKTNSATTTSWLSSIPSKVSGWKPNLHWSKVGSFLGTAVALVVVCWVGYQGYKWWIKPSAPSPGSTVARSTPVPSRTIPVKSPKTPRTLEIPEGGLRIWLEEAPAIYPKLGPIQVDTPSGRSYVDTPGIDHYPGYEPAGFYTFRSNPEGEKRSVQIYNRW